MILKMGSILNKGLSTEENEWREKNTEFNQDMAGRYKELANKVVSWGEQQYPGFNHLSSGRI